MNGREKGFLLLSSHLGDPERRVLTGPQLRKLAQRIAVAEKAPDDRDLLAEDLLAIGYGRQAAEQILSLLSDEEQLAWYVGKGNRDGWEYRDRSLFQDIRRRVSGPLLRP